LSRLLTNFSLFEITGLVILFGGVGFIGAKLLAALALRWDYALGYLAGNALGRSAFVVVCKVAVLAKTLRVVGLTIVGARPCFLCAAASVVTIDAHALCIVPTVSVRTVVDLSLVIELMVGTFEARDLFALD